VQDIYSRKLYAVAMREKTQTIVVEAFEHLVREAHAKPSELDTDQGPEFKGPFEEYLSEEKQKNKVMHEVGILLRLNRHPNVVKLFETFETGRHILLVMELCAGGDLLNYVRKRKKLDE
jgi:serine/threonine protein kinase